MWGESKIMKPARLSTCAIALLFPCLFALQGCGGSASDSEQASFDSRIINGSEVALSDSPQIVRVDITFLDGSPGICSGTVIGTHAVLTAGHCFARGAQAAAISGASGVLPVKAVGIHPGYSENTEVQAIFNDLAVLVTDTPIGLPALGILASRPMVSGDAIGIWGYGLDENDIAGTLKAGAMSVEWASPNHIASVFTDGSNTCNGDSGGPATASLLDEAGNVLAVGIVGVTSTGANEDCSEGDLSLFSSTQSPEAISFIQSIVPEVVVY